MMIKERWIGIKSKLLIYLLFMITASLEAGEVGRALYEQNCAVCHADDGSGAMPGVIDLTVKRNWITSDKELLLTRLKKGIQTEGATMVMPPKGGNPELKDQDLLLIIEYMHKAF